MQGKFILAFTVMLVFIAGAHAQKKLPDFDVTSSSGRVIVSWKNEYEKVPTTVNIQRSFDSIRNFTTIGTTLNPEAKENGYLDVAPPYDAMYYRMFITFEGGAYVITNSKKAGDTSSYPKYFVEYSWQKNKILRPTPVNIEFIRPEVHASNPGNNGTTKANLPQFPSRYIFTTKVNSVSISVPLAGDNKYSAKFFDEAMQPVFEIKRLSEEFLILDKANFPKSGWYYFELYENGILIEKNKFQVPKDTPKR